MLPGWVTLRGFGERSAPQLPVGPPGEGFPLDLAGIDRFPQSAARHHFQVKDPMAADMRVHCLPRWPRGAIDARNSGVEPMNRIETYRVFGLCVALAAGAPLLQGCSDSKGNPPPTGTGGGGTGQAV